MLGKSISTQNNNIFPFYFSGIALQIVKNRSELADTASILAILAKKPEAFTETTSNIFKKLYSLGKHIYSLMYYTSSLCCILVLSSTLLAKARLYRYIYLFVADKKNVLYINVKIEDELNLLLTIEALTYKYPTPFIIYYP